MAQPIKVECMTSTSLPRNTNSIDNTGGRPPPVSSILLVLLGRLVLVMLSTLIGYAIGHLPNQNPHGYPGLLI